MPRVLLFATTTGYQTRTFGEAADRLGIELVFATDRCHVIDDPWRDAAIPIRFFDEDASVDAVVAAATDRPIDGVLAVGDRPTVIAARVAQAIGLPWHTPEGAAVARHKLRTRERLREAGLPVPWFLPFSLSPEPARLRSPEGRTSYGEARRSAEGAKAAINHQPLTYPCVVKPVALSGSRGVMRANDPAAFTATVDRLRALMRSPDIRAERTDAHDHALVEGFIPGHEYAVEAVLHHGAIHPLAIFDKPDPLDGPFFEETIYLTPPDLTPDARAAILRAVTAAAQAIGLGHGPIHAECRVNGEGVFVLEVAARPIGGLCGRAVRFDPGAIPLEEFLLRHALGESPAAWQREGCASGVMMIPIPRRGVFRGVDGLESASGVPYIDEIRITAKADQLLLPLPEGGSYLGFIFARADRASDVERALRLAHRRLRFAIDPEFTVRPSA